MAISTFCVSGKNPHSSRDPASPRSRGPRLPPPPQAEAGKAGRTTPPSPHAGSPHAVHPDGKALGLDKHSTESTAGSVHPTPTPAPPGGPPPELRVLWALEMFILHLPVCRAITGNRIHSPGNLTSSGHRRETLLGPGLTAGTTEGRSTQRHRVTSPWLASET